MLSKRLVSGWEIIRSVNGQPITLLQTVNDQVGHAEWCIKEVKISKRGIVCHPTIALAVIDASFIGTVASHFDNNSPACSWHRCGLLTMAFFRPQSPPPSMKSGDPPQIVLFVQKFSGASHRTRTSPGYGPPTHPSSGGFST